jgi:hypothetical protein
MALPKSTEERVIRRTAHPGTGQNESVGLCICPMIGWIKRRVGYDKAHCKPSDCVKTNQWVCALTL